MYKVQYKSSNQLDLKQTVSYVCLQASQTLTMADYQIQVIKNMNHHDSEYGNLSSAYISFHLSKIKIFLTLGHY